MDNLFKIEDEVGMDLTPLIDVIFMLLIFFIMTTTFSKPVLDIVLPESEQAESNTKKGVEILISVKKNGNFYYKEDEVSKEELISILTQDEESLLNLFVDKDAPFSAFVEVVDIAKQKRGGRFVISTEAKSPL